MTILVFWGGGTIKHPLSGFQDVSNRNGSFLLNVLIGDPGLHRQNPQHRIAQYSERMCVATAT